MAPIIDPYNFSGYLADQLQESSGLIHGYNSQIESFRNQLDEADSYAEHAYAPVLGGSLLGAIGAALAGGNIGQIAGGAYGAGAASYNNLEAIEKSKRENLAKQILDTEGLRDEQIKFSQGLVGAQGKYLADMGMDYAKGSIPELTPGSPYQIDQQAKVNQAAAMYGARNPAIPAPLQQQVEDFTGVNYGAPLTEGQADLAKQTAEGKRRKDQFERSIKEKTPWGVGELEGAKPLDSRDAKFVSDTHGVANKILTINIPNLRNSIESGASIDQIKTDTNAMVEVLKELRKQGANFTMLERELNISQLPTLLDTNPGQLATYLADTIIRGQDPIGKLDRLAWTLEAETNAILQPYGRFLNKGQPLTRGGPTRQPDTMGNTDVNENGVGGTPSVNTAQRTYSAQEIMAMTPEQRAQRRAEIARMLGR